MRLITLILVVLLGLIQIPLWLGKGGWFRVWELHQQAESQKATNAGLKTRNASLEAEVRDLKNGTGAIEERARYELGMVKEGEAFVRIVDQPIPGAAPAVDAGAAPPATSAEGQSAADPAAAGDASSNAPSPATSPSTSSSSPAAAQP